MFNGTSNNPRNLLCVSTTRAVKQFVREKYNMDQQKWGGRKRRANSNLLLGYLTCFQIPYPNTYKTQIWISSF